MALIHWTEPELDMLRTHYPEGGGSTAYQRAAKEAGFPDRTIASIQSKAHRIGLRNDGHPIGRRRFRPQYQVWQEKTGPGERYRSLALLTYERYHNITIDTSTHCVYIKDKDNTLESCLNINNLELITLQERLRRNSNQAKSARTKKHQDLSFIDKILNGFTIENEEWV